MKKITSLLLLTLLLAGCGGPGSVSSPNASAGSAAVSLEIPAPSGSSAPEEPQKEPIPPVPPEEPAPETRKETLSRLLSSMTLEEKVGQLFFARCPETDGAALAQQYHLGGYLLFGRDFKNKSADEVRDAIDGCQNAVQIPLLIGADEEGGTVVRISSNPQLRETPFLSPQQLYAQGGMEAILTDTAEKDALLRSLGVNVNFAPVADLSENPEDFIYQRAFGQGPEETSQFTAAVAAQMERDDMGSVLKHFPGYGSNPDTHTGSALDSRPLDQFLTRDFLPFRAGIEAVPGGTAAVLVSHNVIQAVDPSLPASLSPAVLDLLREELRFDGVALTDDLAMEAVAAYASDGMAPVLALTAGVDMVVTSDFQTQISQVLEAVEKGQITPERLDQAVTRVLGWKYDLGLLEGL